MICSAERTGGQLSANNISIHSAEGYNFYTVAENGRKIIVGGVPEKLKDNYIAEAKDASAIVLLTSKPEFCAGVGEVVTQNPNIEVYATAAGLRNIKEIINADINEKLIKDKTEVFGLQFVITPNLPWVDTVSVIYGETLFSGELFSGGSDFLKYHYEARLKINRDFVVSALDALEKYNISQIYPAIGDILSDKNSAFSQYREFTAEQKPEKTRISLIYNSEYGFTKSLAEYANERLGKDFDVYFTKANDADYDKVNKSDIMIIGTNTINRNAPQSVWEVITHLDLVNKRGMPYFVFGSFGWAGDGIKLVDKTLQAMGMKQITKPVEVLFAPCDKDFEQMDKAIAKVVSTNL